MRCQRTSTSMSVCWNACPMCSVPVTFGGGSWIENDGRPGSCVGSYTPLASQRGAQRASMAAGSKDFARSVMARSHQQVFARIVAAEDHVVHLADVGEAAAAGVGDRALHVLLHLAQRVGERALDLLEDALALDVLVLALVEVGGRAVVLLVELAVDLDRLARALLVAGEQRADH